MSVVKNIFGRKEQPILSYNDFWTWFQANEQTFYDTVKSRENIEEAFFDKLSPKLDELKSGIFFLAGMKDDHIAELVFTPDGKISNIVFVEELVNAAPTLPNWNFIALKPAISLDSLSIEMEDHSFNEEKLSFYATEHKDYPDEIDIVIVHNDYTEENKPVIINGTFLYLDNYLGELHSITTIDNITFISKDQAEKELVPIAKLKDYLIWREKEFIEKYSGIGYNTENDGYSTFEAQLANGRPLVAIVNTTLLEWDSKASHPWILKAVIEYDGDHNNGFPDSDTYKLMDALEDDMLIELRDVDGYLNIGRETADNTREVYFACKDFRKPSKTLHNLTTKYAGKLNLSYDIYKDKYWQSFERYRIS